MSPTLTDTARLLAPPSLPGEILRGSARRLRMAAFVWTGLWSTGLVMNNIVGPIISPDTPLDDAWPWPGNPVAFGCILLSVALILHTRRKPALSTLLNLALLYEVALAFGIGVVNQWTPNTTGLSWICVLILVHPLIVPNDPLRTFVASMLAASMDLVGLAITGARGVPLPDWQVLLWTYLPNYMCAVLAVLPAHLIAKLGREVSAARELGSYRLGERLGHGGMGEVYRAQHRMLARPVAIKLVRPELVGANPDDALAVMSRFEQEAQATALMRSPHTIEVYDCGITDDGVFYYVMEFLDGFDLDQLVRRFGPLPPARTVHVLRQVCDSLAEAHDNGLIHRDIKPANVHVCRYGRRHDFVKLLDFGLAKQSGTPGGQASLTGGHEVTGTPSYMAPEQALASRPVDGRTDLYGVGCVGYWLLTGRPVFEGRTIYEVITSHATEPPDPPSRHGDQVPECLDRVILACLEKDMDRRPGDADALDRMLAACEAATGSWSETLARRWWEATAPERA